MDWVSLPTNPSASTVLGRKRSLSPKSKSNKTPESPDPDGLLEYSVVYTRRSLNHMSQKFQQVMRDISSTLKNVYGAHSVALVPGGGTYAMESVARQFGTGQKCLVVRNGYFSYRWSQIFEACSIPSEEIVLKGRPVEDGINPSYEPCPIEEVVAAISKHRPQMVFAPHVETSSGIMLPDSYMQILAKAVHDVGGLFVLDCIASGCMWVSMETVGADVIISAPQKSWSASPCAGIVMLSEKGRQRLDETQSTSFAVDLKKWVTVVEAYENGGHMYHATMPTDSITRLRDAQLEMKAYGFERLRQEQCELGQSVRSILAERGFKSVAAAGFGAPGVVVSYTSDPDVKTGSKFAALGMQIAAGVPLMLDEFTSSSPDFRTFRLGLFGIDKLRALKETASCLENTLDSLQASVPTSRL
jgi:aspartate aminotransferase-like enzyme